MAIETVGDLVDLLVRMDAIASENVDSGFTELDHGLQCAFELAARRPQDVELQIAGLVHDIGHLFAPDAQHGRAGAEQIRRLLGSRVAVVVDAHVAAKRYLVSTDPSYQGCLSGTSVATLAQQGGHLGTSDLAAFRVSRHFDDAVTLRRADDAAKIPGRVVPSLDAWIGAIEAVAVRARSRLEAT